MGEKRMHSIVQRANTLSTVTVSTMGYFAALLALSSFYFRFFEETQPVVDVKLNSVLKFGKLGRQRYLGNEEAILSIDVDADLRKVWNWNVKQLFVYVTASFETPAHNTNEVILWDFIITSQDGCQFSFKGLTNKYNLADKGAHLKEANVTLAFRWDTMPYSGLSFFSQQGTSSFLMPNKYVDNKITY
eukprot:NODE_5644_length_629_cov_116.364542_g5480_i0.p1 GENE.NODE_5644_length_629_cov_116.364542_g5480_i0~~NODE_5644_length_629_cov_116.364542_g5480_i0.p1  ORF type:complete len:209 (-),score=66.32 NODE_5644_length_629_cov_116.364542_g5480_i0:3-566(-)